MAWERVQAYKWDLFKQTVDLKNWHQHPKGHGWVENTAFVADTVYVGKNCIIAGNAKILDKVRLSGGCFISGNAIIADEARIRESHIYGHATVNCKAQISKSRVWGHAVVSGNAKIDHGEVGGDVTVDGEAFVGEGSYIKGYIHLTGTVQVYFVHLDEGIIDGLAPKGLVSKRTSRPDGPKSELIIEKIPEDEIIVLNPEILSPGKKK